MTNLNFFFDRNMVESVEEQCGNDTGYSNVLDDFISNDDQRIRLTCGKTIRWSHIKAEMQSIFCSPRDDSLDSLAYQCVSYIYDFLHRNPKIVPFTNRDFLGLCIAKIFTNRGMGRNQLKLAMTKIISSMIRHLKERCLHNVDYASRKIPQPKQYSYESPLRQRWIRSFQLFQPITDEAEAMQVIQRVELALEQKRFLKCILFQHIVGERTIAEISNLFEMNEAAVEDYLNQSVEIVNRSRQQNADETHFIGRGI